MTKLLGVIGSGMIGRDPWDGKAWSGSATPFFRECQKKGILEDAIGVEVPPFSRYGLMALNFNLSRKKWQERFWLDTRYFEALTSAVHARIRRLPPSESRGYLQIGAIYDVPSLVDGKVPCYSYNDGNLACRIRSPFFDPSLKSFAQKALRREKNVNQSLTKVFTMSEYLRHSFIEDYGVPENRVVSIGVGMNFAIPGPEVTQKDYSDQNIIFIGIDFHRKGGPNLIKAFSTLKSSFPRARLHIIGPRTLPEEVRTAADDRIIYHGLMNRNEPRFAELMRKGTLAVLPSLYEPFGIAILECMTYGMPAIATDRWAFPEVIQTGENGCLVPVDHSDALAEAMESYLRNPELAASHGEVARQKTLAKYGWGLVVENLDRAIQRF